MCFFITRWYTSLKSLNEHVAATIGELNVDSVAGAGTAIIEWTTAGQAPSPIKIPHNHLNSFDCDNIGSKELSQNSFSNEQYNDYTTSSSHSSHSQERIELSQYYIQPEASQKLVKTFCKFCQLEEEDQRKPYPNQHTVKFKNKQAAPILSSNVEDSKRAFELLEMKSRIMDANIKRGLERRVFIIQ